MHFLSKVGVLLLCLDLTSAESEKLRFEDGVDVTFPIHHQMKDTSSIFATRYAKTMAGCYAKYTKEECDAMESSRLKMNLDQPSSQHNYTDVGFKKIRTPDAIWGDIKKFYAQNKGKEVPELWPRANTYVNSWDSPTQMVSFEDNGGEELKQRIWDSVKPILAKWSGQELKETSLYGIRVYHTGAILATHVDRLPLVTSAIIQVAQDVDEPWPLEVVSHDGRRHNITMDPGDMILYESHTVLHGRPYPLKGNYYANIFVHFVPINHDEMNQEDRQQSQRSLLEKIKPIEIISPKKEEVEVKAVSAVSTGVSPLHAAAISGDLHAMRELLEDLPRTAERSIKGRDAIHYRDRNGWQAVHEAARTGNLAVLQYLVEKGADLQSVTSRKETALQTARGALKSSHPAVKYLEKMQILHSGGH